MHSQTDKILKYMYRIGIDLGGTKVEGVVIDKDNNEVFRERSPNGREKGYEGVLWTIKTVYSNLIKKINNTPHTLGVGMPGSISKRTGLLKNCNIQFMNGMPFVEDLKEILNHNLSAENDANCFAMAEAIMGAGKGKEVVFGVIIGTGCGGGLVVNGKVIRGLSENTGEWGHSIINYENGAEWGDCPKGIVEAYISGSGIETQYKKAHGTERSVPSIVEDYRNGCEQAKTTMHEFFNHFGISVSNLIKYIDPDVIVLGGGVSNVDEIYTEGLDYIKKYVFHNDLYTPVVKNEFGDSAGVFGAALIGVN